MSSNPSLAATAFRLSSQQERAWISRECGVQPFAQCQIGIEGTLDIAGLQDALRRVIAAHEILRTQFRHQAGIKLPFQVIQEDSGFHFEHCAHAAADLPGLLLREQQSVPDIEKNFPVRALLVTQDPKHHTLILTVSAFCADAASLKNLCAEIGVRYQSPDAADDVMQYADLVEWQNELLASEETKPGRDFWREHCRDIDFAALEASTLPLEKKGDDPAVSPDSLAISIPEFSERIAALTRKLSASADDVLLTAWNALFLRLLGRHDITIGCEFDGRRYQELEGAIGPLARTLPLRMEVEPGVSFATMLKRVQSLASEARNWQESFAWSQVSEAESPFLPFAFSSCTLGGAQERGGVRWELERVGVVSEPSKLRLGVVRRGSELELEFHYDANRLERRAVERIASCYQNLLAAALVNPEARVADLPLLSEAERQQIVVEWNQTAAVYPAEQCVQELFEQQAARTPEREAVRGEDLGYSYRELNERANRLAHYLRKRGVGPDQRVGLCVERTADSLVAVLAILKAGGAYVPLQADHPAARLGQQLQGAVALITEAKFTAQMPPFPGPMVVLDGDQTQWASEPPTNLEKNTTPENLVYVIFTSGSTGVPKGVAVRHRNLVNYADDICKRLRLQDDKDKEGLQFATVSTLAADLGNTCIYPALISGGCVHLVSYERATDARAFAEYVRRHPLDVLKIVPSHLGALLQSDEAAHLLPRKYLILGGEALTPQLLEKIASFHPTCEIVNHYGPTETTVGSLTLQLKDYDWRQANLASIPIGRPIQNTQVYILDANLQPVPVGVTGELYIAGAGVTAGYVEQAEKTAERFVNNPFAHDADSSAKMYRTGDLARYGEDGKVEFIGRGDDQVKVRGFRIELGEIETVLARHAGVKQALVVARADEQGEKRLVGYVVGKRELGNEITGEGLRTYLKQQLPEYMVPQALVVLPKMPLNANGKIDRRALPEPEAAGATHAYVAPRSQTERAIAQIWAEVLRRDPQSIGVEDNFFDLGGHSLLATQVISRLRRALNIEFPLRALFESPVIAALAQHADKAVKANEPEIPPIVRVPRDQSLPLSFAQQRLWVLDRIEPDNPLYNIARAFRLKGQVNTQALIDSLNEIVRRHESQRTTFATDEHGQPVQRIAESLTLQVPILDLRSRPESAREADAKAIAATEASTSFDLSQGPLLRAKILRLDSHDHVLLLTMHHIVSDAWSAGVFIQELSALYEAYCSGKNSPLLELPIQYADYSVWQRSLLQGKFLERQLDYWRTHLAGAPPLLQLPSDRPRPAVRHFDGSYEAVPLPTDVSDAVKAFSQAHGVTPFMTMLAAFKALLSRYSGQDHIVLGTDIANRTTAETERLIGFFINLLPLHTDLSGDPTFAELVSRVREVALGAYAHQDIPFDKLVEDLQPERNLSHNPIVQALFVMQNIPNQRRGLAGLELTPFLMPITRSKFDIAVFIGDNETVGHWLYSTELFERSTVLRIASNFETLLRHAVSNPKTRLSSLPMLSDEERRKQAQEAAERKQSQRKKLMSAAPKPVDLASAETGKKTP